MYLRAFARKPSSTEVENAISFLAAQAQAYGSDLEAMHNDARLWTDYCHSIFNLKEFIHLL